MPSDISILEPTSLRELVQKFPYPNRAVISSRIQKTPWPESSVTWEVIKGSHNMAKPNVPNSEAHIVPRIGVSQESATFLYTREKKVFEPTTLHWLKAPGTLSNRAAAEQAVTRELLDLNERVDNLVEWTCWRAMSGAISFSTPDVVANVDTKIPSSHKPAVGTTWVSATPQQIIADIKAWKKLISRDGGVEAQDVFLTESTLDRIFNSWVTYNSNAPASLLTDTMKDQYYKTATLPGFLGLNWNVVESFYNADATPYGTGNPTSFVADDAVYMANLSTNRPMELFEGPTADDEAPTGFTGKFTKTWKEKDPSARQVLLEYHFFPVITRPEQFVYVADVSP